MENGAHFSIGHFCGGCVLGAILHTGCFAHGTARVSRMTRSSDGAGEYYGATQEEEREILEDVKSLSHNRGTDKVGC